VPSELAAQSLRLRLDEDLDPSVARLVERDLDAIAATLEGWGRFTAPVRLASAPDLAELRLLAGGPTDGPLCAVATPNLVALLEPARWPHPPADHELRVVLTHELAHALLFQRCAPAGRLGAVALPCWFREGMAVRVSEGRPDPGRRLRVAARGDFAALAEADAGTIAADPDAVYDAATTLFDHWMTAHGDRRLTGLCRAMRAGSSFDAAHRAATGVGARAWLQQAVMSLRAHALDGLR
jgi:hypothetical protein